MAQSKKERPNYYSSDTFKFIVEGEPFNIHSSYLENYCGALAAICLQHDTKEKAQGYMVLSNVTIATFMNFADWLYGNDLFISRPATLPVASKSFKPPADVVEVLKTVSTYTKDDSPKDDPPHRTIECDVSAQPPSREYLCKSFTLKESHFASQLGENYKPIANNEDPSHDFTETFLTHARLYVFADQWFIQGLKSHALINLFTDLRNYNLWAHRTCEIVELLAYVYGNTAAGTRDSPEPMRDMLMTYVGLHVEVLLDDAAFLELVAGNADLMGDFAGVMKWRLTGVK